MMRRALLAAWIVLVPAIAHAQGPFAQLLNSNGTLVSATAPLEICVVSSGSGVCSSFPTAAIFNFDTGAGTVNREAIGLMIPGSGGPAVISANNPMPVTGVLVGNIASGNADSGNPVKIGGRATTSVAAVTNGQRVNATFDRLGRQMIGHSIREGRTPCTRVSLTNTTETTICSALSSTFHDLVFAYCTNESATEVRVDWRDSTGGTVRFSMDLAPDGGTTVMPIVEGYPQTTVNNNWTVQLSGSVSTVYCTALARMEL